MKTLQRLIQKIVFWIKPELILLDGEYKLTMLGGDIGFIDNIKFEHIRINDVIIIKVPSTMITDPNSVNNLQSQLSSIFGPDKTVLIMGQGMETLKLNKIRQTCL